MEVSRFSGVIANPYLAPSLVDVEGLTNHLRRLIEQKEHPEISPSSSSTEISTSGSSAASVTTASLAQNVANVLPQRVKRGKKRAKSVSLSEDELPAPKKRKSDQARLDEELFVMRHRLQIRFGHTYANDASLPANFRRLLNVLNHLWTISPEGESCPLHVFAPRGSYREPLVASLQPSQETIFKLPPIKDGYPLPDYDFTDRHSDLFRAFVDLRDAGHADIQLSMVLRPAAEADEVVDELHYASTQPMFVALLDFVVTLIDLDKPHELSATAAEARRRVLHEMFPPSPNAAFMSPTVSAFISHLQPSPALPSLALDKYLQPKALQCQLLPFQRRTLFWMLNREGLTISPRGQVQELSETGAPLPFWEQVSTPGGATRFLNRISGELSKEEDMELLEPIRGGILAEEMGCGKTVESIALILLSVPPKRGPWNVLWNEEAQMPLHQVKSTLIVTPISLQRQWVEEFAKHAPSVKVLVFNGWRSMKNTTWEDGRLMMSKKKGKGKNKMDIVIDGDGETPEDEWANYCQQYDVVITTYNVLSSELNVAKGAVSRPRREKVDYSERSRPRSPLVLVEFWRVLMDEVQMAGGTSVVDMVSRIPRVNSFAVSGTPARASVADLLHVLQFIRVPWDISSSRIWKRIISPGFFDNFMSLFDTRLVVRTCKSQVKDEFELPKQTRYIVPIEFGKVERTIYDDLLETGLSSLEVDERGVAKTSGWAMDISELRTWLHRLRQVCTHPQVAGVGRIDKLSVGKGIKSMEEVLETMRQTTDDQLAADLRKKINLRIRHSQLLASRPKQSMDLDFDVADLLKSCLEETNTLVSETEEKIKGFAKSGFKLMEKSVAEKQERRLAKASADRSKGKGREMSPETDDEDGDEDQDEDVPFIQDFEEGELDDPKRLKEWRWWIRTERGKDWRTRMTALHARRRENLLIAHKAQLLLGDVHFRLKDSENEKAHYEEAEKVRSLLLGPAEKTATKSMTELPQALAKIAAKNANDTSGYEAPTLRNLLIDGPTRPGILTTIIFEEEQEVIDILNEQTRILFEWKSHVIELITQPLITEAEPDDEKTPYERALEIQQECEAFLMAYQALLADRREAMIAERTQLAALEDREVRVRKTAAASKAQKDKEDVVVISEEKMILNGLDKARHALRNSIQGRALKSTLVELVDIIDGENSSEEEIAIAKMESTRVKRLLQIQGKQMDRLERQLAPIRKTFNERIEYFRQLQAINDSVTAATWEEGSLEDAIVNSAESISSLERSVNTRQARQRYLDTIFDPDDEDDEERSCVLCKCDFEKGVLLGCVHHFCEDCILLWMTRGTNKFCPVCRAPIEKSAIQRIHLGKDGSREFNWDKDSLQQKRLEGLANYSVIPDAIKDEILDIDVVSEGHGSKIMFLVKHLLWLQKADPGSKAIVFSAWASGLS
ncbi:hypothetical protein FRC19_008738, partial [Serendipita sp. 401]